MKEIETNKYIQAQFNSNLPAGVSQRMIDEQFGSPDKKITQDTGESEIVLSGVNVDIVYKYDYNHLTNEILNIVVLSAKVNDASLNDIGIGYEDEIKRDIRGGL